MGKTKPAIDKRDHENAAMNGSKELIVLIPARNELKTIGKVISEVMQAVNGQVVVIDDASTDGTAQAARSAGAIVLPLTVQLGAWGALRTGLHYAHKKGYRVAVTMDADGQHLASTLHAILEPVRENGVDVAVGSYIERGSAARKFSWLFFRGFTMLGLQDLTSGLRAYNRTAIKALVSERTSLLDYQDIGVLLHLRKKGCRILEVPVVMNLRQAGRSRVFASWWNVWRYLLNTMVLSLSKSPRVPRHDGD